MTFVALETAFDGRTVLITDGLGFIGSNLARRLVELGAEVTLVDSLIPQYGSNPFNIEDIRHRVQVNVSDVRDQHSFQRLVEGQNFLFNLAGQTSHMNSMSDPFTDLNCFGDGGMITTPTTSWLKGCAAFGSTEGSRCITARRSVRTRGWRLCTRPSSNAKPLSRFVEPQARAERGLVQRAVEPPGDPRSRDDAGGL